MMANLIDTFTLALEQHYFELRWGAHLYMDFFSRVNATVLHKPWTSVGNPDTVQLSLSVVSDSLQSHGLQHTRLPCPSPTPRVCSNSCPLHWWCHPTISSSLSSPSPPAFNLSQHQGLFQRVSSSHQVAKVLEFQLQHYPFQWTPRTDFF